MTDAVEDLGSEQLKALPDCLLKDMAAKMQTVEELCIAKIEEIARDYGIKIKAQLILTDIET